MLALVIPLAVFLGLIGLAFGHYGVKVAARLILGLLALGVIACAALAGDWWLNVEPARQRAIQAAQTAEIANLPCDLDFVFGTARVQAHRLRHAMTESERQQYRARCPEAKE